MQAPHDGLSHRLEALIEKLPEQKQTMLRELLVSLLEPAQKMQAERDSLERLEEKYLLALKEDSSNVLDFRPPLEKMGTIENSQLRRWNLRVPCLIEAASSGEIFRMAFELHLRGSRSIFLSWQDIDPAGRQSAAALSELVSCTIFIPDVTLIQESEENALAHVLGSPSTEKPHFMVGTYLPYAELLRESRHDKELLELLSQAYLKLNKPVAQYKREGLLRYFLESLS